MTTDAVLRAILRDLLSVHGPMKGARLSTLARRSYEMKTGRSFDLRRMGFEKFSHVLEANHDLVSIETDPSGSDLTVSLREGSEISLEPEPAAPGRLAAPLWQAFANPDPERVRYYNRLTGEVGHFRSDSTDRIDANAREKIASWGENAVRIPRVSAEEQGMWMREFLGTLSVSDERREALERLIDTTYTSSLNAMFSETLGPNSASWRRFRAERMIAKAQDWATENGLSLEGLPDGLQPRRNDPEPVSRDPHAMRESLHALIDLLSDDDLSSVMVPLRSVDELIRRSSR